MTIDESVSDNNQNNELNHDSIQSSLLNILTNTFKQLRDKNNEQDILQTSVEIVHQILECDRVVVYSLLDQSQGEIVAEALTPGFTPALGSVIEDPCFETRYINQYQRGRVKATANIYEAGMSACYIENLEQIEVKANLVIPLIQSDSSLLGLMVMHQCRDFREWQQSEINFAIQIAGWTIGQVEKAKEYNCLATKLAKTNQWQDSLIHVIHEFNLQSNKSQLLQVGVDRVREFLECDRVVVYSLATSNLGKIVAESSIEALAPILGSVIEDSCFDKTYKDQYQQGRIKAINNIYEAGMSDCYVENLEKIAVKASVIVPINLPNEELYGLLVVHQCFAFRDWQPKEIEWLKAIGIQMGASLLRTKFAAKMAALEETLNKLDVSKDSVTFAKDRVAELRGSMQDTMIIFSELNNLQNLLLREISLVANPKETKVVQIIMKKITLNIQKVKNSLSLFQANTSQLEEILDDAATNLYNINEE
ncbi:MAG: GAF domain-containing protein [Xenococcaceae cyanobacterium MO_188.B19]|nr:GAF domain-containing protein [Xenococcaceae cyanobacterium MO_188.B19]